MKVTRSSRGGIIPLILGLLLTVILVLAVFSLRFTSMLGSHQEQTTATQAASLAAAKAIGRIVVNDPQLGFISLTDSAPRGRGVAAADGFGLPVRSFNGLLATIRLDMIIADTINDPVMKQYAESDYQSLLQAKDRLTQAISAAANGAVQIDHDGNNVNVVTETNDAYNANVIRMGGNGATLKPGSLKVKVGCLIDARTNMQIPQPISYANTSSADQENGFYRAYRNIPYGGRDFVFAAVHDGIILVDHAKFVASPNLPYFVPSIVWVEADEQFKGGTVPGSPGKQTVHSVACAQSGTPPDPRSAAGALLLSFPDGKLGEISKVADIRNDPKLGQTALTVRTTVAGDDYPQGNLGGTIVGGAMNGSQMWSRIYYDWLRRGGPALHVKAVVDMQNPTPLRPCMPPIRSDFLNAYFVQPMDNNNG